MKVFANRKYAFQTQGKNRLPCMTEEENIYEIACTRNMLEGTVVALEEGPIMIELFKTSMNRTYFRRISASIPKYWCLRR